MPTTYNLVADVNFNDLGAATLVGTDVFNINGCVLTVDSDTRWGYNHKGTTGNLGGTASAVTISTALGGQLKLDGTVSKLLRYYGGSGTMPVTGSQATTDSGTKPTAMTWVGGTATITTAAITTADNLTTTTAATTCTRAAGSFITEGIVAGMSFISQTGATIAANTYVQSVNSATSLTLTQNVTTGVGTAVGVFNQADNTWASGQTVTISNCYPTAWNGTYTITGSGVNSFTVAMTNDPGTIIDKGLVTRKYMVSQALTKTPPSTASYVISGAGPYLVTLTTPNHNCVTGNTIVIAGSVSAGTTMNGSWVVTRVSNDVLTFSMPTSPVSVSTAGTFTKTVKAEYLSIWNTQTAAPTAHTTAAAGSGFTGTVTVTHAYQAGDIVTHSGMTPAALNGTYKIETVTTTTAYTYFRVDNAGPATVQGLTSCAGRQLTLAAADAPGTGAAAPVAGASVTANGFIKVRNVTNGPFEHGTLTVGGGTTPVMTATSSEMTCPIEVVGCDAGVINVPRQGKFISQGEWYYQPLAPLFTQAISASGSSGAWTVTVTTAAYFGGAAQIHKLYVGQEVKISGVTQGAYNGTWRITAVPTPTTFTFTNTTTDTLSNATVQGSVIPFLCTTGQPARQNVLPITGASTIGGIWVEKYPFADTGDGANSAYDFYPNQGTLATAASVGTDWARGRVCWVTAASGILRIGHDGTNIQGYNPKPGCKIRYGNIFTVGAAPATPGTNIVTTTLANRYKWLTTSAGYITIDKSNIQWASTFAQPFYVSLTNTTVADQITVSEIGSAIAWDNVIVGPSASAAGNAALLLSLSFAGGTISNSCFTVANAAASTSTGATPAGLANLDSFTFTNCDFRAALMGAFNVTLVNSIASPYPANGIYGLNLTNCTFNGARILGSGKIAMSASSDIAFNNTKYSFNNATAYNTSVVICSILSELTTKSNTITFDGIDWSTIPCTSMSCTTNVVTVTTGNIAHGIAAGVVVDVNGCLNPGYNAHSVTLSLVARTTATCTTVIGDKSVTTAASYTTSGVLVGDMVTGTGIPINTYVESIQSATVLKLTNSATAAGSVTLTFNPPNQFTYPKTAVNISATTETTMTVNQANVNQPTTGFITNNNCDNIIIKNIGSYYSKLNMGTNSTSTYPPYLYSGNIGTSAINVTLKNVYTSAFRSGVYVGLNSLSKLTAENVHCMIPYEMTSASTGFRSTSVSMVNLSSVHKGCSWYHTVPTGANQASVYGTHWFDTHVTAGDSQIHIMGNEASPSTTSQVTEAGTNSAQSGFNSAGAFVMPNVGDELVWTSPYKILGHLGFATTPVGVIPTTTVGTASVIGTAASLTITASSWAAGHGGVSLTGNTSTSINVTNIANTDVLYVGCPITGSGFATGTVVASIVSSTAITLSLPTTTTLTGTALTYGGEISFTAGTHRLQVGDTVTVSGTAVASSNWYGVYTVSGITSATVFRVKCAINPGGTAPSAGTVTVPYTAISLMSYAANILTVTTGTFLHGYLPGDQVVITDALYTAGTVLLNNCNGKYTILTVPTGTTFTIAVAGSPGTTPTANTGTIRMADNIKLTYDIDSSGTFKSLRKPLFACSTASAANGVVSCSDTTNVSVGDWVYANNIAAGGAKVTAVSPNTSFTLGRNNVTVAGGASTTVTSFTAYATVAPGEVLPAANIGYQLKVKATAINKNSVTQITNVLISTSSTRATQAYQYVLYAGQLNITGLTAGSEVRCYYGTDPNTALEIGGIDSSTTEFSLSHNYGGGTGYIQIFNVVDKQPTSYNPFTYSALDNLLVQQVKERNYLNP